MRLTTIIHITNRLMVSFDDENILKALDGTILKADTQE
jgi:hypothetical protein